MKKITSKSGMSRPCLMSFILLCSVLTSENALSRDHWGVHNTKITYNASEHSMTFTFNFFDYRFGPGWEKGYLRWCDFNYSVDGENYTHLMRAETYEQDNGRDWSWLRMRYKKAGEKIEFLNCYNPINGTLWPNNDLDAYIEVKDDWTTGHKAWMTVKWFLPDSLQNAKYIKLNGFWKVNGSYVGDDIVNTYHVNATNMKSNKMKDTPAVLNSEICNTVKVPREDDAIIVTGAKPSENIKVCTIARAVVNAVVTNSDVVNIKVAKNQVYMVTVGKSIHKVAL